MVEIMVIAAGWLFYAIACYLEARDEMNEASERTKERQARQKREWEIRGGL